MIYVSILALLLFFPTWPSLARSAELYLYTLKMRKGHFPEKAMSKVTGHDTQSLRALAVALSRACIFGDTMLLKSSPSEKGYSTSQLDPQKSTETTYVRQTAWHLSNVELQMVWVKCVVSISKTYQNLQSGRLTPNSVKLWSSDPNPSCYKLCFIYLCWISLSFNAWLLYCLIITINFSNIAPSSILLIYK